MEATSRGRDETTSYPNFGKFYDPVLICIIGHLVLVSAVLYGRWLNGRKLRNLPASHLQLAMLAVSGILLIAIGLWADLMFIRLYVWMALYSLGAAVGLCLGAPLFFCWVGGILLWQAFRRQQAHWSGSITAEEEWLPRQSIRYSTGAFIRATFANLVLFVSAAYLTFSTGPFDEFFRYIWQDGSVLCGLGILLCLHRLGSFHRLLGVCDAPRIVSGRKLLFLEWSKEVRRPGRRRETVLGSARV